MKDFQTISYLFACGGPIPIKVEKISTKTFRQRVYEKLRQKIISAEILPDETVTMRELARIFGVSLMPVREALWQLESEKVIVIESNRNIRVNSLTPKEMLDSLTIRVFLECMAAKRACEERPDSVLPKVKHHLIALRENVKNYKGYLLNNSRFHFAIYSCCNSPLLIQQIHYLWARIGPYLSIHFSKGGDIGAAMKFHEEMYVALCRRDKKRMTELVRKDLEAAGEFIFPRVGR